MNLPTRSDLTALGERLSALEAQIAGLSTEQRRLADALEHANSRRNGS
jgi:BMFP domain-containing protein YqiC